MTQALDLLPQDGTLADRTAALAKAALEERIKALGKEQAFGDVLVPAEKVTIRASVDPAAITPGSTS